MKILVLHNEYRIRGGEDVMVDREVALLKSRGNEVITHKITNHSIKGIPQKLGAALNCSYSVRSKEMVNRLLKEHRPDLCHVHNFFPLLTPSVYDACRENSVPVVQTLHNYRLFCANGLFLRDKRPCELCLHGSVLNSVKYACYRGSRLATLPVAKMIAKHRQEGTWSSKVDGFVTLTSFAKQKFAAGGLPETLLHTKYNFCEDLGLGKRQGDYAVYLGRLSAEKGILTLLESWSNDFPELVFVGDGELSEAVVNCRKPNVRWAGTKGREAALQLLSNARLMILPTECYEGGTPSSLIEALCLGIPVIMSKIGGTAEVLKDSENALLFEAGSPEGLSSAVRRFLGDNALEQRLSSGARITYERMFTPEKNYGRLLEIYGSAIANFRKR